MILLTFVELNHGDNHLDQDRGIHWDKVVVKKDKKFESPKIEKC